MYSHVYLLHVSNCQKMENILKKIFKVKYTQCITYGNEYFQGNYREMMNDIYILVYHFEKLPPVIDNKNYDILENLIIETEKTNLSILKLKEDKNDDKINNILNNKNDGLNDEIDTSDDDDFMGIEILSHLSKNTKNSKIINQNDTKMT